MMFLFAFVISVFPLLFKCDKLQDDETSDPDLSITEFTAFDWSMDPVGYIISGTITLSVKLINPPIEVQRTTEPGQMMVDPVEGVIYFNLASGGKFAIFRSNRTTYNWNNAEFDNRNGCAIVPNFGYDEERAGYSQLDADNSNKENFARYVGLALDSNACGRTIGVDIEARKNIIRYFYFAQLYNLHLNPANLSQTTCANIKGSYKFEKNTPGYAFTRNRTLMNTLVQLPATCFSSPIDFCSAAYAPGNACDVMAKPQPVKKRDTLL